MSSSNELKPNSSNPPLPSKKKGRKRRNISKQIKGSRSDDVEALNNEQPSISSYTENKSPKKRKIKEDHIKDPITASTYLTTWKGHQNNGDKIEWKFNKNTQSWLIRHMYDSEKVPKSVFALLVEYLVGMQGETVKHRILEDATHRAIRYKQYEKSLAETPAKNDTSVNKIPNTSIQTLAGTENSESDDRIWTASDDHVKRKEYKRARKILDTLQ
jgi:WKF domain